MIQAVSIGIAYDLGYRSAQRTAGIMQVSDTVSVPTKIICHGGDEFCEQAICDGDKACLEQMNFYKGND